MNACWVSQLVFHQILNAVSGVFKENDNGEIMFHLKRILRRLSQAKGLMQVIVKFRAEIILCTFLSSTKIPFCRVRNIVHQNDWIVLLLKGTNWKFIFSWRKINWYVLQITKARLRNTIWFIISEKSITRCTRISNSFSS